MPVMQTGDLIGCPFLAKQTQALISIKRNLVHVYNKYQEIIHIVWFDLRSLSFSILLWDIYDMKGWRERMIQFNPGPIYRVFSPLNAHDLGSPEKQLV